MLEDTREVSKSTTQGLSACFPYTCLQTYSASQMEIGWERLNKRHSLISKDACLYNLDQHSKKATICIKSKQILFLDYVK